MQGRKHYQEKLFTSFQLSDRVPAYNLYRKLLSTVDFNFLYKQTAPYYGTEGQESIDPIVFFKLMLVGYLENLASDRRIIHTSSMRLDILYFIGYDIDEALPWHSTLSRTRQLYGEDVFRELFKRILKQCIDKGMVAGRRQAVDSVHVKANASMDSIAEKEILSDADAFARELKENEEENNRTVSPEKKNKVDQHHRWKTKAYHGQPGSRSKYLHQQNDTHADSQPDDEMRAKFLSNHTHYSTTDPDARIAVKPGKPRQFNYLGQTSVDTAHHVITHIHADFADKKDSQCLAKVIKEVKENFQSTGLAVEQILADTGYSSGEALKALEQNNITGYIPNFGKYKPERVGFTYHKEEDHYTCSQNKKSSSRKLKITMAILQENTEVRERIAAHVR
jgi:transposase